MRDYGFNISRIQNQHPPYAFNKACVVDVFPSCIFRFNASATTLAYPKWYSLIGNHLWSQFTIFTTYSSSFDQNNTSDFYDYCISHIVSHISSSSKFSTWTLRLLASNLECDNSTQDSSIVVMLNDYFLFLHQYTSKTLFRCIIVYTSYDLYSSGKANTGVVVNLCFNSSKRNETAHLNAYFVEDIV